MNQPTSPIALTEIRLLGSGRTSDVYLCQIPADSSAKGTLTLRAVKKIKQDISPCIFKHEQQILKYLCDHPNIIEVFPSDDNQIITEFAAEGELFDFALAKPFEMELARYYMIQLLNVLDYAHSHNVYHRDLKLENLFLDEHFILKVGDFGLAGCTNPAISTFKINKPLLSPSHSTDDLTYNSSSTTEGSDSLVQETLSNGIYFEDFVGTENYMAPEMITRQKYLGEPIDIFAFGVILFSLIHGFPPYKKIAHASDPFYRLIMENDNEKYWALIERKTGVKTDANFKDLMFRLLEPNPIERITIEGIKVHPWMHGDLYSHSEVILAMQQRKTTFQQQSQNQ